MAIADENGEIMWAGLDNQLADNTTPSYDQNIDTGDQVPLSDIWQPADSIQGQAMWDINAQQAMWPMKITEEALELMKAQEQAEQEAAAAAAANQLSQSEFAEQPIATDSYNIENDMQEQPVNPMDESNNLWTYSFWDERVKIKRYNTGFILSVLWLIIFWWLAYITYLFYEYLAYKSLPTIPSDKEKNVMMISNNYDKYGQQLWMFNLETYKVIYLENELTRVDDLLKDATLNFNQKKDDLQRSLLRFWNEIITIKNDTKTLREKMNKEGFFPQEIVWILDADNAISSIQRSLISLEVVKFSSAIRVFSLMDDIVKELADNFDYTKTNISERLQTLIDRWEQDVEYYLNVCYNNPYEPEECNNINDFDKYYLKIKEGDEDFDTEFFKKLMKYLNNQIEYNDMPSFSITFNSFDGKSNNITFSVEVNTTIEDEKALTQEGIKNPHIFIISELIKLLKQSTFIVWKGINAKNIKVADKVVTVAWRQFNVHNSINTYTLPIQKTTEREIFDFIETYSSNLQDTWFDELWEDLLSWFDMSGFNVSWFNISWFDMSGFMMSWFDMSGYEITWFDTTWFEDMSGYDLTEINSWVTMWEWSEGMGDEMDDDMSMDEEVVYNWEVTEETAWFIADDEMLDE